jgi:predicted DCC family thiol-disulfide oxidoreductase YuxK
MQSQTGRALLAARGLEATAMDTLVLVEETHCLVRSDAILAIVQRLGPPWSWLKVLRLLPRRFRDSCYALLAHHRYRWFGRKEQCLVPTEDIRSRFLP